MTTTTTLGVFSDKDSVEGAINGLKAIGINDSEISYLYVNADGEVEEKDSMGETVAKSAASGATTGAIIGGIAGITVAAGLIPGLGALFIGGPIAAALGLSGAAATTAAGALTGAAAGGLIGALTGLGVGAEEAKVYEERVKSGDILLLAQTDKPGASAVFMEADADEVREYSKND